MYSVSGTVSSHQYEFNPFQQMVINSVFRDLIMPLFHQQQQYPVFYPGYSPYYQPVQQKPLTQIFINPSSTVVLIHHQTDNSRLPIMQLPSASTHSQPMSTVPVHYNSYFSSSASSHSRPIQINAPSSVARYTSYNNTERVMGLDFDQPSTNNNTNLSTTNIDSVYYMDFMDDENLPASSSSITSHPHHSMRTESIESALRRAALSTGGNSDDKENGSSSSSTKAPSSSSPSQKESTPSADDDQKLEYSKAAATRAFEMRILGHSSYNNDENLINEETESEAGFSGEDDCMSNCGCVHSCIGSPIDFAPSVAATAFDSQPFARLGFRSIGDIIGYVNVVKSERLEALNELKNAVDKFNDMRQRKNQNSNINNSTN